MASGLKTAQRMDITNHAGASDKACCTLRRWLSINKCNQNCVGAPDGMMGRAWLELRERCLTLNWPSAFPSAPATKEDARASVKSKGFGPFDALPSWLAFDGGDVSFLLAFRPTLNHGGTGTGACRNTDTCKMTITCDMTTARQK